MIFARQNFFRRYGYWWGVGAAFMLPGCLSFSFKDSDVQSKNATHATLSEPWKPTDSGISDVAYRNSINNSTIALNSVCDQYQKLSLEELSKTLIAGMENVSELSSEPLTVDGFPALLKIVTAQLDGQPFKMAVVVLRSPQCVYDITFVSKPAFFGASYPDFQKFISSFHEGKSS